MLYTGPAFSAAALGDGIVELKFDLAGESVNKLNAAALQDFAAATQAIAKDGSVKGVIVTSGKSVFIVGADITEFGAMFAAGEEGIAKSVLEVNRMLSAFEDLPVPTVIAINGVCLGGGLELALAGDYRVMSTAASVGFPEVKLGIFPGFGGSVRMPRIIGVDNAVEWICTGADKKADAALKDGAVDAVVAPEQLRDAALAMLQQCIAGKLDWKSRRAAKLAPLKLNKMELTMAFTSSMGVVGAQAGPNYPAPMLALKNMQEAATLGRDAALEVEAKYFAKAAVTPQANALIGVFLADQGVKKAAGSWEKKSKREIKQAAVLGAGIMGGGIAYQAAYKGLPIVMKDIRDDALALGMNEAGKLLSKQVERGRMTPAKMSETLGRIRPTLELRRFRRCRHHHRGGRREPEGQDGRAGRGRRPGARGHDHRVQHVDHLDQPAGRGPQAAAELRRHALLQPGEHDAAGGSDPRQAVVRGRGGRDREAREPDGQDAGGRERLPGLLRQPRAVPVLRRLPHADARRRGLPGHRQGHGAVRLADGPRVPDGRRRHGHRRARRGSHGPGVPGPHAPRLDATRPRCWSTTSATARRTARAITSTRRTRRASRRSRWTRRRTS